MLEWLIRKIGHCCAGNCRTRGGAAAAAMSGSSLRLSVVSCHRRRSVINELWKSQGRCSVLSVCLSVRCIESNLRATDCFNNKKKKMNLRHVTNLRPALLVDWKMTVESPGDSSILLSSPLFLFLIVSLGRFIHCMAYVEDHHSLVHNNSCSSRWDTGGKVQIVQSNFVSLFFVLLIFVFRHHRRWWFIFSSLTLTNRVTNWMCI